MRATRKKNEDWGAGSTARGAHLRRGTGGRKVDAALASHNERHPLSFYYIWWDAYELGESMLSLIGG